MRHGLFIAFTLTACLLTAAVPLSAQDLRIGAVFEEPEAKRFVASLAEKNQTQEQWVERSKVIRQHIKSTLGLDHQPTPCDLSPLVTATHKFDGYSVDNIAIQTLPGFWLTGNLYRPNEPGKSIPGILSPHGHWKDGRTREDQQKLSAALARAGAVVFSYDMVGFEESRPVDHKHPQVLKLQTYNSIRALDYLCSMPNVDQTRLGCTGASGGATQTFLLAAVDDRLDVSVPVCQVSAHYYGGCICESGLPIHVGPHHETNNVEIAASFAPKPQLIVSNGEDWTKNCPEVEFPFIKRIYELNKAGDQVEHAHFASEGHDYGPSKRTAAVLFLCKHLSLQPQLSENGDLDLSFVTIQPMEDLKVFPNDADRPANAVKSADEVFQSLTPPSVPNGSAD